MVSSSKVSPPLESNQESSRPMLSSLAHYLLPQNGETSYVVEDGKAHLQDYALTQEFALVHGSFQRQQEIMSIYFTRHHPKKKEYQATSWRRAPQKSIKAAFQRWNPWLWLKKNKLEFRRLGGLPSLTQSIIIQWLLILSASKRTTRAGFFFKNSDDHNVEFPGTLPIADPSRSYDSSSKKDVLGAFLLNLFHRY